MATKMIPLDVCLQKIFSEDKAIYIYDRNNDNSFPLLFSLNLCKKTPSAENDKFGRHVFLERFFKESKIPEGTKIKKCSVSERNVDDAILYYQKMGKTLLEFFYKYGYNEVFHQTSGQVEVELGAVESDDYYDVFAYYAYKTEE